MYQVLHSGWGISAGELEKKLTGNIFHLKEITPDEVPEEADVFLVGPEDEHPVKTVQKINAADKYISILILSHPHNFHKVKQMLQFAPFVGKNTGVILYNTQYPLEQSIQNAAIRSRQRRGFSKMNNASKSVTSLASAGVRVENLGIFLEQAPIGALLLNEQDQVLAINKKAREIFKTSNNVQYVLKDFFPALTIDQIQIQLPGPGEKQTRIVKLNNQVIELHLSAVKNEERKQLFILLVNDITEQKKKETALAESEALFRFMAEAMPQKVWTADAQGKMIFFNKNWEHFTGLSQNELKNNGWMKSIHPEDLSLRLKTWNESIQTGKDFEFEQRILSKEGEYRWHLVRGIARKDHYGKIVMWVGTNTDIHDQVAFTEELEKRVHERTIELEKSNSELEQFVYVTSHDLQEPLRKIRLFSELLKDNLGDINQASEKYLDKINATAQRMTILLKELLNFTQLSREEQVTRTDLNNVVQQCLVDLELAISQAEAKITIENLPVVQAVPVQMHQLFYNLLNNAIKFRKPGSSPEIKISCRKMKADEVNRFAHLLKGKNYFEILVKDNGIGFGQNFSEQIFHIFQRLHNRNTYSGTGIGLALCKKVVSNHHGHIYAESAPGEGAKFFILLPVDEGSEIHKY